MKKYVETLPGHICNFYPYSFCWNSESIWWNSSVNHVKMAGNLACTRNFNKPADTLKKPNLGYLGAVVDLGDMRYKREKKCWYPWFTWNLEASGQASWREGTKFSVGYVSCTRFSSSPFSFIARKSSSCTFQDSFNWNFFLCAVLAAKSKNKEPVEWMKPGYYTTISIPNIIDPMS